MAFEAMRFVIFLLIDLYCIGMMADKGREVEDILYPPLPLVYPYGGTLKLVMGYAMPISLGNRILAYGQNFQFQFPLPPNITEYHLTKRRRRSASNDERKILYNILEQQLQRWGSHGRSCMMRSICEASETPLGDGGLVDELFNVILTPDYGNKILTVDEDYVEAALAGRRGDDCSMIYSDCPKGHGLLDRISEIHPLNSN